MSHSGTSRVLVRAGFALFVLALLTGLVIPLYLNPRMALAAHLTGVLNGLVLVALGLSWDRLTLTASQERLVTRLFLYAAFTNWAGSNLAAAWGTGRLTPLSSEGFSAAPWKETVVQALQLSVALTVLTGGLLVVYGLRPAKAASRA